MKKKYNPLDSFKSKRIKIARELGYGKNVIAKIQQATSENQVVRILADARANI